MKAIVKLVFRQDEKAWSYTFMRVKRPMCGNYGCRFRIDPIGAYKDES